MKNFFVVLFLMLSLAGCNIMSDVVAGKCPITTKNWVAGKNIYIASVIKENLIMAEVNKKNLAGYKIEAENYLREYGATIYTENNSKLYQAELFIPYCETVPGLSYCEHRIRITLNGKVEAVGVGSWIKMAVKNIE